MITESANPAPDYAAAPAATATAASIRRRLTVSLLAGTSFLSLAAAAAMYVHLRGEIVEQYDLALRTKARALASLVEVRSDGGIDFEFAERAMPEYRADASDPDYFQIWNADGTVFARSPSLRTGNLPHGPAEHPPSRKSSAFYGSTLPGDLAGRGVWLRFRPRRSWEEMNPAAPNEVGTGAAPAPPTTPAVAPAESPGLASVATSISDSTSSGDPSKSKRSSLPWLHLSLASARYELDETLSHLLMSLMAVAVALSASTVLLVIGLVRSGLRPLRAVADAASRVTSEHLDYRFPTAGLPAELQPICGRLNDLLAHLDEAFRRERRFTSNVAHELRTPICELRSIAEVAIRWPGDEATTLRNFQSTLSVATQMEAIVSTLLALVRSEADRQPIDRTALAVRAVVEEAWRPHAGVAGERGLTADIAVPDGLMVESERTMLVSLLGNLFSNAVAYAPAGGALSLRAERVERTDPARDSETSPPGVRLTLTNPCEGLTPADLPHLAEPFWRKDAARSDGSHAGLGLTLVRAYAAALDARADFDLPQPGVFRATLLLPAAAGRPARFLTVRPDAVLAPEGRKNVARGASRGKVDA